MSTTDTRRATAARQDGEINPEAPVTAVSIGELVERKLGRRSDPWQLALVQRSLVWDEVRVARLLDSLLAGYPIGSILLCGVRQGGMVLVEDSDGRWAMPAAESTLQLLDGQQRINAVTTIFAGSEEGKFLINPRQHRPQGSVAVHRADKRRQLNYLRWSSHDDELPTDRHAWVDLSRFADWTTARSASSLAGLPDGLRSGVADVCAVLREIDPEWSQDLAPDEVLAGRATLSRLIEIWTRRAVPVERLIVDTPADVLEVFTRINLEGVQVAGDDVFFAGVKTLWPGAESTMHRVGRRVPIHGRIDSLRLLSRLASVKLGRGDLVPLSVDRLNGKPGRELVQAIEHLAEGPEVDRISIVSAELAFRSRLGHALRFVHPHLLDHVLAWAAAREGIRDGVGVPSIAAVEAYLIGATAFGWMTVLTNTFSRLALREALAAGAAGEDFPLRRIVAAARRASPELRQGRRSVEADHDDEEHLRLVTRNAHLFLAVLQDIPWQLPKGKQLEWDHIFPQAQARLMRWKGADGVSRLQNHPSRHLVWQGGNLWGLDRAYNNWARDRFPTEKLDVMRGLVTRPTGLGTPWPADEFLSEAEERDLLRAEAALRQKRIEEVMQRFAAFVRGRGLRIWTAIFERFPEAALFRADADVDPWEFDDRAIPANLFGGKADPASEPDGRRNGTVLSPDEIRSIALGYLWDCDPDAVGVHYYDILHAIEAEGVVADGDGAPRVHSALSSAPTLFRQLGKGRFAAARPLSARRFWAMRLDTASRDRLWPELLHGRFRQGWGSRDNDDLRVIASELDAGKVIDADQRASWRSRRMLTGIPGNAAIGDVVVIPHMPAHGRWTVAIVAGAYYYDFDRTWRPFRHVLPVRILTGRAGIDGGASHVTSRLRRALQHRRRLWNLDALATDIEPLIAPTLDGNNVVGHG